MLSRPAPSALPVSFYQFSLKTNATCRCAHRLAPLEHPLTYDPTIPAILMSNHQPNCSFHFAVANGCGPQALAAAEDDADAEEADENATSAPAVASKKGGKKDKKKKVIKREVRGVIVLGRTVFGQNRANVDNCIES